MAKILHQLPAPLQHSSSQALYYLQSAHSFEQAEMMAYDELQRHPEDWALMLQLVELLHKQGKHKVVVSATASLESEGSLKLGVLASKEEEAQDARVPCICCRALRVLRSIQHKLLALYGCSPRAVPPGDWDHSRRSGSSSTKNRHRQSGTQLLRSAFKQFILLLWKRQQNAVAAANTCEEAVRHRAVDEELHALRCRVFLQLGKVKEAEHALQDLQTSNALSAAAAELQVQLLASALRGRGEDLLNLRLHVLQLARQPQVRFAAIEGALVVLRQRGMLEECDEVCALQHQLQQQVHTGGEGRTREMRVFYCQGLVHKCAGALLAHIKTGTSSHMQQRQWMSRMHLQHKWTPFGFQPWKEMGIRQLMFLLNVGAKAPKTVDEELTGFSSNQPELSVAACLLSLWDAALGPGMGRETELKIQLYRWELAFFSRGRAVAAAAKEALERLIDTCSQEQQHFPHAHGLLVLAEAYLILGHPAKALSVLQQAKAVEAPSRTSGPVGQFEETARAQLLLAELLLVNGQTDAGAKAAAQVTTNLGPTYKGLELMAKLAERQKNLSKATRYYHEASTSKAVHLIWGDRLRCGQRC
ncbi:hypothetical protein Efla_001343 [Eimeria flavescens]